MSCNLSYKNVFLQKFASLIPLLDLTKANGCFSVLDMSKTVAMTVGVKMPSLTHHSLSHWSL